MTAKPYSPLPLWPAIALPVVGAGLMVLGRVLRYVAPVVAAGVGEAIAEFEDC